MIFIASALAGPCLTPQLFLTQEVPQQRRGSAPPSEEKAVSNVMPGVHNLHETTNFAIWWGDAQDQADIAQLADALELAWSVQLEGLGYPVPPIATSRKFNVYIGDTGGPSSLGASGYYWYDDAGDPMLVLNPRDLGSEDSDVAAAHEFFHAVQDGTAAYSYDLGGAWYFEATAMWIENQVYPDSASWLRFVHAYVLQPELSLHHFDYPETWDLSEFHHYGAALFIEHLATEAGDRVLLDSWIAPDDDQPLVVLKGLVDLDSLYRDFAIRSATFDFPHRAAIQAALDAEDGWDHPEAHRPSGGLVVPTTGSASPPDPPHSYGATYWRVSGTTPFRVEFDGEADVDWTVALVVNRGGEREAYAPGAAIQLEESDDAWLVVAAIAGMATAPSYGYTVSLTALGQGSPDPEPPRACGCNAAQAGWRAGALALVWIPALVGLRRRTGWLTGSGRRGGSPVDRLPRS